MYEIAATRHRQRIGDDGTTRIIDLNHTVRENADANARQLRGGIDSRADAKCGQRLTGTGKPSYCIAVD